MAGDALSGSVARAWLDHSPPSSSVNTISHRRRPRSGMVVTKLVRTMPLSVCRQSVPVWQGPCV